MVIGWSCKYSNVFRSPVLIGRKLDQKVCDSFLFYLIFKGNKLDKKHKKVYIKYIKLIIFLVTIMKRIHPFPSRTRQLSSDALTILGW